MTRAGLQVKSDSDWRISADNSLLRRGTVAWMPDAEAWFERSFERLPETVRVNPLRNDSNAVEVWLQSVGAEPMEWYRGPGSSWVMPFERGGAEGEIRKLLISLHETGRLTRQEAVSMIPVMALNPKAGEAVLDMCASPGSKTSQIAEFMNGMGVLVANERSRKRCNLLVANIQRHRSRVTIVSNHDGRHIPSLSGNSGYDAILVDAPCTGSGTTRKNPEVWSKWKPSGGLGLHSMQVGLLNRAVDLLRPGGRVVYSTCSLAPVENEAVISQILQRRGDVRLTDCSEMMEGVSIQEGLQSWVPTDDDMQPLEGNPWAHPPTKEISEKLSRCVRVRGHMMDAGGFFLATIEKKHVQIGDVLEDISEVRLPEDSVQASQPLCKEDRLAFEKEFGSCDKPLWKRGKRIAIGTERMLDIWNERTTVSGGKAMVDGGRWRPLNIVHVGCEISEIRSGRPSRIIEDGAHLAREIARRRIVKIGDVEFEKLLAGEVIETDCMPSNKTDIRGGWLVSSELNPEPLPVWIGGKITAMMSKHEGACRVGLRGL
ncbi:MAG TPA: RsmB/NOP family class I SAM-dependent RNA methyltransferase [Candidatus Thalassarchaeaceae archaeon]|nr:MAG TPA: RsmB/NOP family class I SAM-dependent RNA methyltransferase [Candidatus Poseidoniales archaeon]HII89423.1 RsmB/NOP family class I SAM-dependent RNA methyltransferase [Candidatus Thalassarchaeaceae archaeon]